MPQNHPPILSNQNLADHLSDLAETLADWARLHDHIDVLQLAAERLKEIPDPQPAVVALVNQLQKIRYASSEPSVTDALTALLGELADWP